MKMCKNYYFRLISRQLDDDLTVDENFELFSHLKECGDCQQKKIEFEKLKNAVKQYYQPEETLLKIPPILNKKFAIIGIAAVIICVVGIGLLFRNSNPMNVTPVEYRMVNQTVDPLKKYRILIGNKSYSKKRHFRKESPLRYYTFLKNRKYKDRDNIM